ncbi:nuclear transport factor 2 family protein [Paraburkholderia sp. LEh10]|uniref:nuclear transport factor 2 family protein n=1 Tax=Paraburkholderia sp. LEh10 TaxID=2821353 RepID=UPI001AE77046|nr:nuclear transport factor 2 family protein [Paraburkholderia sp. LEh10]MBP0589709.1 nuclear transport factor 2 family protein [Paraburkholderia sp. LEh10]
MCDLEVRIRRVSPKNAHVIASFLAAFNRSDADGMGTLFRDDALVNDQLRNFWGRAAIDAWIASEVIADNLRIEVLHTFEHYRVTTIVGAITGTFDANGLPNPLILNLHFSIFDDRIARLFILLERKVDTSADVRGGRPKVV